MHCDLAQNIIMFKMQMNQDVNDGEGLRDWDVYGEPSLNRFLKCFFTLAEYVIGISVEHLSHSDIGKCNLAYT